MLKSIFSTALVMAAMAGTQPAIAGDAADLLGCRHSDRNIFDNRVVTGDPQRAQYVIAPPDDIWGDIWLAGIVETTNRPDMVVGFGYDNGGGFQYGKYDTVQGKGCIYFHFRPSVHEATAITQITNFVSGDKAHITIWVLK